jgi:hypothetical protein
MVVIIPLPFFQKLHDSICHISTPERTYPRSPFLHLPVTGGASMRHGSLRDLRPGADLDPASGLVKYVGTWSKGGDFAIQHSLP